MIDHNDLEKLLTVDEETYAKAVTAVTLLGRASPDILMEIFGLGAAKSYRIMDMLEADGIVGPGTGKEVRTVRDEHMYQVKKKEP